MWQRRFWGRRRNWTGPRKRRPRKIILSERGIYEPVELEEDVLKKIVTLLWYCGVPCFHQRERVPKCNACGAFVSAPSDPGHPDLHGWIPPKKFKNRKVKAPVPFYLEVKRPSGGVEEAAQKEFIKRAERDGVPAAFVRSWAQVRSVFAQHGCELPELG